MQNERKNSSATSSLRRKAEAKLEKKPRIKSVPLNETKTLKLLRELALHQIEMELKNEELRRAKENAEKATALYDYAPAGYFTLNRNGTINDLYLSGANMLGRKRSSLINTSFNLFVTQDTQSIFNEFLRNIFNSNSKQTTEVRLLLKQTPSIYAHIEGIASEDKEKCYITAVDITDRKRETDALIKAKEKAEENDRVKTAFLKNMSYEVRTPVNTIVGFSDILNDPDLDAEKRRQFTDIIIQSSDQLLSLITDVISISSIESGQEKICEKEVNLNSICRLIYDQFIPKAENQNIILRYKTTLSDNEATIIADEQKLTKVLTNLVSNALKFTMKGYVEFGYRVKEGMLKLYVEDTGIGIPPEMQDEIFKRFRKAEITDDQQIIGSGLGLSISKAYVELLGGSMWLSSKPGKGSTFCFTLPYKKASGNNLAVKQPARGPGIEPDRKKTVLIAEDEDLNFNLMVVLLSRIGLNIIRAVNGVEAVDICKSNRDIDLVLMDIKMPIMDGNEATRRLRELRPDLPVIAQTAYASDEDQARAYSSGCSDFISKPFGREQLISKVSGQLVKRL